MEKEYQVSWLKIVGITILIVAVIVIICLVYPKKDNTLLTQQTYISNITLMKDAGFEYFTGSNLPQNVGDSKRITLDEMLARNLIVEFLDEDGNSCNTTNSYIEATKTMDNEYEMSVYLSCDHKSDYIVTSISNDVVCPDCNVITADNSGTANNNSGNNSSNSSNNGGSIKPTYTSGNNTYTNSNTNTSSSERPITITQTTNVNINYVNTCCTNGSNTNCSDHCLANVYHSVVFDSNGGSSVRTQIVKHGGTAIYVEPYRYGYTFLGWYLNGKKYDFKTPVTEKITLIAKWEKKDTEEDKPDDKEIYIVDFDSNGGSSVPSQKVEDGNTATRPTNPTRDCYDFAGWYTDKNLTRRYDFATPVTSDMTLYAKWVENDTCKETYRVRFDSNGGSSVATQRVEEGNRAEEPRDPKRSGYTFLGWYLNNKKFSFNTRIYENITLVAKWEKDEVKYNEYCKIKTDRYYSISYVPEAQSVWNKSWNVYFYKLDHADHLKITKIGYLTNYSLYQETYRNANDKGISLVGGTGKYGVSVNSASALQTYSLKPSNFTASIGTPYYQNGSWYANFSVRIKNYNNVNSYYASNLGYKVYFIPFYFEVEYTDLDQCVTDKASNSYKYNDYEIVDSFYK